MICTDTELLKHTSVTKEASGLRTNIFSQYLVWDYLIHNDCDAHIGQIRQLYREQTQTITEAMDQYFPETVRYIRPRGGMFLWVILLEGVSVLPLFPKTLEKKVAFVPDGLFYINMTDTNTMRLDFTSADCDMTNEGIRRLGEFLREM